MTELLLMATATSAFILGRSMIIWTVATYLVGWPVALMLWVFGPKKKTWENRIEFLQKFHDKIEEYQKPKEYKEFNTVDDLFKQLETK